MSVAGQDLSKLLPQAIPIAFWLKENAPKNAADLLTQTVSQTNVSACLTQLLAALDVNNGDLSNSQLRYILSQYEPNVWAQALRDLVCRSSQPSLIPQEVKAELLDWAFFFLKENKNAANAINNKEIEELYQELTKYMNKLGHVSFRVLGEFCSLVRDTSTSNDTKIARELGPSVFMLPRMNPDQANAARFLFEQMVTDAERLFGQSAIASGAVSFGIRSKSENTQWGLVHTLPVDKKRRQDLRTFYAYIEKRNVAIVDKLFEYHDFIDIAHAINIKYGMIPTPWKTELRDLQRTDQTAAMNLNWFVYENIKTPTPGAGRVPRTRQINYLAPNPQNRTRTDELVDALIDSETNFFRRMGALGNFYVKELRDISSGFRSIEEMRCLGLTAKDVDLLFGYRFQRIMDLSHQILTAIEPISLLRTRVKVREGREGILAKCILEVAPQDLYQAYAPFSVSYPQCADLMRKRLKQHKDRQKMGYNFGNFADFVDIWERMRPQLPTLEDKSLTDVLEFPVRRIHTYRELIRELLKITPTHSVSYKFLYDAFNAVGKAADALTAASAQHAQVMSPP